MSIVASGSEKKKEKENADDWTYEWAFILRHGLDPCEIKSWMIRCTHKYKKKLGDHWEGLSSCISNLPPKKCILRQRCKNYPLDPILIKIINAIQNNRDSIDQDSRPVFLALIIRIHGQVAEPETLRLISKLVSLAGMEHLRIFAPREYIQQIFCTDLQLRNSLSELMIIANDTSFAPQKLLSDQFMCGLFQNKQISSVHRLEINGLLYEEGKTLAQLINRGNFTKLTDLNSVGLPNMCNFESLEHLRFYDFGHNLCQATEEALIKYALSDSCLLREICLSGKKSEELVKSLGSCRTLRCIDLVDTDAFDLIMMLSKNKIPITCLKISDKSAKPSELIEAIRGLSSLTRFEISMCTRECNSDQYLDLITPQNKSFHPGISYYSGCIRHRLSDIDRIIRTNRSLLFLYLEYRGANITADTADILGDALIDAMRDNQKTIIDCGIYMGKMGKIITTDKIATVCHLNQMHLDYWSQLCFMVSFIRSNIDHPFRLSVIPLVHNLMNQLGHVYGRFLNRPDQMRHPLHHSILDTQFAHNLITTSKYTAPDRTNKPTQTPIPPTPTTSYRLRDRKRKLLTD